MPGGSEAQRLGGQILKLKKIKNSPFQTCDSRREVYEVVRVVLEVVLVVREVVPVLREVVLVVPEVVLAVLELVLVVLGVVRMVPGVVWVVPGVVLVGQGAPKSECFQSGLRKHTKNPKKISEAKQNIKSAELHWKTEGGPEFEVCQTSIFEPQK